MILITCLTSDRISFLEKSLKSWSVLNFDKIIIVNWILKNQKSVKEDIIKDYPQVDFYEVFDKEFFNHAERKNLCMKICREFYKEYQVFCLDSDVIISEEFYKNDFTKKNNFWQGFTSGLFGSFIVDLDTYFKVNGHNEKLLNYGREDGDFYNKLIGIGRKRENIKGLIHQEHDEKIRVENMEIKNKFLTNSMELKNNWEKSPEMKIHEVVFNEKIIEI